MKVVVIVRDFVWDIQLSSGFILLISLHNKREKQHENLEINVAETIKMFQRRHSTLTLPLRAYNVH